MAKAPRKGGKGAPPKRGAKPAKGKKPAAKKPVAKAKPTRAPAAKGKGGYEITCSECYSTFQFRSTGASDITCPECLHAGTAGDSAAMSDIAIAKSREAGWLKKAMVPVLLFFGVGVFYAYMLSSKAAAGEIVGTNVHYGFLGGGALLFILMIWFAVKYEGSRHDVYF
ncbi:MAG: hypothetical protein AAF581_07370 [Planctomycetota bacterium]